MKKKALVLACIVLVIHGCHVGRFFLYNFSDVRDYKKFPSLPLRAAPSPFYFYHSTKGSIRLPGNGPRENYRDFEDRLERNGSLCFLVIRNDSIIYEWNRKGFDKQSVVPSFSMAKSFVSALIGIAIDEGKIKNTAEPITNYIDFLDKREFGKISIQHLLDMQSGIKFNESYINPFGEVAKYYYGNHLKKFMRHLKVEEPPGRFVYKSVNTQLLALILENATGKKPSEYLQEKIWEPLGMEYDASWSVDGKKEKTEKAFCCINARALDFAKLGRLYLREGNWQGRQIISKSYVHESVTFSKPRNNFSYSNQWWHTRRYFQLSDSVKLGGQLQQRIGDHIVTPSGDFFAQGHLGQFVYVYPTKNIIVVRLGKKEGKIYWPLLMREIAEKN